MESQSQSNAGTGYSKPQEVSSQAPTQTATSNAVSDAGLQDESYDTIVDDSAFQLTQEASYLRADLARDGFDWDPQDPVSGMGNESVAGFIRSYGTLREGWSETKADGFTAAVRLASLTVPPRSHRCL